MFLMAYVSIAMYNKAQVVLHFDRKGGKVGREGNKERRGAQKRTFFPLFFATCFLCRP